MSLQFILGNSGFGKTTYIYNKIIKESMEHPEMRYYCLVPEQFTLQTQRDFVLMHPRKGILNIDVLSFQRLAYHVLDEVGEGGRMILEETGKNIVLRKLAKEHEEELKVLGRNLKKLGYISEVKSLISELTQYQITPEMLEETKGDHEFRDDHYEPETCTESGYFLFGYTFMQKSQPAIFYFLFFCFQSLP